MAVTRWKLPTKKFTCVAYICLIVPALCILATHICKQTHRSSKMEHYERWPDWANFCLLGDYLLRAISIYIITEVSTIFSATLFHGDGNVFISAKNCIFTNSSGHHACLPARSPLTEIFFMNEWYQLQSGAQVCIPTEFLSKQNLAI
jgi:hypothetical protein